MKNNKLIIVIDRPLKEVFNFTLDPNNAPKWIDSITVEETNEHPSKLGTIYKNRNEDGEWAKYEITEFEQNKTFTLSERDGSYHVRYTFSPVSNDKTNFEYYEWVDEGKLNHPFTYEVLEKLKVLLEK